MPSNIFFWVSQLLETWEYIYLMNILQVPASVAADIFCTTLNICNYKILILELIETLAINWCDPFFLQLRNLNTKAFKWINNKWNPVKHARKSTALI